MPEATIPTAVPAPAAVLAHAAQLLPSTGQVVSVHGPYEDLAIAGLKFAATIVEGQPAEFRRDFWMFWLQVMKEDRANWLALPERLGKFGDKILSLISK